MSKKKVNQRAIHEISKNLKQSPVYRVGGKEENIDKTVQKNKIDPRVIVDLKKVGIVIGLMVLVLAILAYVVYKTEAFTPLLNRFNINY
jgi:uncharacterized membrane protein